MPVVDIAPQHAKANPITKGLVEEHAGPILEPHEAVEYRTSSHNLPCGNLSTSIDKCKGSSPIKAEPNLSTSIYSWKDRHA